MFEKSSVLTNWNDLGKPTERFGPKEMRFPGSKSAKKEHFPSNICPKSELWFFRDHPSYQINPRRVIFPNKTIFRSIQHMTAVSYYKIWLFIINIYFRTLNESHRKQSWKSLNDSLFEEVSDFAIESQAIASSKPVMIQPSSPCKVFLSFFSPKWLKKYHKLKYVFGAINLIRRIQKLFFWDIKKTYRHLQRKFQPWKCVGEIFF